MEMTATFDDDGIKFHPCKSLFDYQMFRYTTLPSIKWGPFYGIMIYNARAIGGFGAVSVVPGHIRNEMFFFSIIFSPC